MGTPNPRFGAVGDLFNGATPAPAVVEVPAPARPPGLPAVPEAVGARRSTPSTRPQPRRTAHAVGDATRRAVYAALPADTCDEVRVRAHDAKQTLAEYVGEAVVALRGSAALRSAARPASPHMSGAFPRSPGSLGRRSPSFGDGQLQVRVTGEQYDVLEKARAAADPDLPMAHFLGAALLLHLGKSVDAP